MLGDHNTNMQDKTNKGRQYKPIGELNNGVKLTETQVIQIKKYITEGARGVDLAKQYGVSQTHISAIKHGRYWKHVRE